MYACVYVSKRDFFFFLDTYVMGFYGRKLSLFICFCFFSWNFFFDDFNFLKFECVRMSNWVLSFVVITGFWVDGFINDGNGYSNRSFDLATLNFHVKPCLDYFH